MSLLSQPGALLRYRGARGVSLVLPLLSGLFLAHQTALAEERVSSGATAFLPILAVSFIPVRPVSEPVVVAPVAAPAVSVSDTPLFRTPPTLFHAGLGEGDETAGSGPQEFTLLRGHLPRHRLCPAVTGLNGGYGQFFDDDTIGRFRTAGAGLQDPDWLFVKFTLFF